MSLSWHQATTEISSVSISEYNGYATFSGEQQAASAPLLVDAEVIYGATRVPITWASAAQASIASNTVGSSDSAAITIPKGAWFAVARYLQCTAGLGFTAVQPSDISGAGKDVFNFGSSGITNTVGTGSNPTQSTPATAANTSFPFAINTTTTRSTLGIIGDSRARGAITATATNTSNQFGDSGEIARALRGYGYLNYGVYGSRLSAWLTTNARQKQELDKCSVIVIQRKINDITTGATADTLVSQINAVKALFPGKRFIITTTAPAGSADNVTPGARNAVRNALNTAILGMASSDTVVVDVASAVETSPGSGIWNTGYSSDFIHPNETAYAAIEASGIWTAAKTSIGA